MEIKGLKVNNEGCFWYYPYRVFKIKYPLWFLEFVSLRDPYSMYILILIHKTGILQLAMIQAFTAHCEMKIKHTLTLKHDIGFSELFQLGTMFPAMFGPWEKHCQRKQNKLSWKKFKIAKGYFKPKNHFLDPKTN